jgi:predicted RNase H-like HicB family nuclease
MPHYVALIREDSDGCFEVSFPDLPGIVTGGDDFEDAVEQATEVLAFAAEDWTNPDGSAGFKPPRSLDELRRDPEFVEAEKDAEIALIEFPADGDAAG